MSGTLLGAIGMPALCQKRTIAARHRDRPTVLGFNFALGLTVGTTFGTSHIREPILRTQATRTGSWARSDLQIVQHLQCIKLNRLAPSFHRRFVQLLTVKAQACSLGSLT